MLLTILYHHRHVHIGKKHKCKECEKGFAQLDKLALLTVGALINVWVRFPQQCDFTQH